MDGSGKVMHRHFTNTTRDLSGQTSIDFWVYPDYYSGAASTGDATLDVTYTITWTGSGPAPDHVVIKTAKTAGVGQVLVTNATTGGGSGKVSGSVGGTDADVTNSILNTTVNHSRCVRLPVSGGQATYTSTMQINLTSPSGVIGYITSYTYVEGWVNDTVTIDDREVDITSNRDPTYYRGTDSNGNPVPVQNVRSPDGTMYGDTVIPSPNDSNFIDYLGQAVGSWSQDSSYRWYSSLTSAYDYGVFSPDPINPFEVFYGLNSPISDGQVDHIYLHLTDMDNTDATNSYYMKFHSEVPKDEWFQTGVIKHPIPITGPTYSENPDGTVTWKDLGEWSAAGPSSNLSTDSSATWGFTETNNVTKTITGTIGTSLMLPIEEVAAAFQMNEGITLGESYSSGTSQSFTISIPPMSRGYIVWGPGIDEYYGNCGVYNIHGFEGEYGWDAMVPQSGPGNLLVIVFGEIIGTIQPGP